MKRTWKQIIALIIYYFIIFIGAYCFFLQLENQMGNVSILKNVIGAILLTLLTIIIKQYADGKKVD